MLWAYAEAKHATPALFVELGEAAIEGAADFDAQQVSMVCAAHATAGYSAPALFDMLALVAQGLVGGDTELTPNQLATIAHAYASAARPAPALLDALADAAVRRRGSLAGSRRFSPSELAQIGWAYAAAAHDTPASRRLFDASFTEAFVAHFAEGAVEPHVLATLHPWVLWHEERGLACPLPADLARRCHAALESAEGARAPHGGVR